MSETVLTLRAVDKENVRANYHVAAKVDGKVVFDSAFSRSETAEVQLETALAEWLREGAGEGL